jgi:uncharacterized membrane protein YdjX (TVP38/TMEM64 family)
VLCLLFAVCCSASNYLLGLTPVELGPLVVGTVAGMSVWSILYASLGGASKVLLESGADLDVLLAGEDPHTGKGGPLATHGSWWLMLRHIGTGRLLVMALSSWSWR